MVKKSIQNKEGIHPNVQQLILLDEQLELNDSLTIADYNLMGSTSDLLCYTQDDVHDIKAFGDSRTVSVRVRTLTGLIFDLGKIYSGYTLLEVKCIIRDKLWDPLYQQSLAWKGRTLDDVRTLVSYNITGENDYTLDIVAQTVKCTTTALSAETMEGKVITQCIAIAYCCVA
jgi:hypothetical protein